MRRELVNTFNRGEIDTKALMRLDVKKATGTAELLENFMPIRLGPMIYRPGMEHLGAVPTASYFEEFIAATDDVALLEFSDGVLRVWVDDAPVTRTAVTATITNGEFTSDITGWTDDSSGSGTSAYDSGTASLTGDNSNVGALYQTVTINEVDEDHSLCITIEDAPVEFKIGTTVGGSEIFEGTLSPGKHSLLFVPDVSPVTFHFSNRKNYSAKINDIAFEAAGVMTIPTSITSDNLASVRTDQSADVVFVAADGTENFEIQRRGPRSWSVVDFRADDGPFQPINITGVTLEPTALTGDTTVTASADLFKAGHVGSLLKISSSRQTREASISADNAGTGSIKVTGIGSTRQFTITRAGTWTADVTLQRSTDDATWDDVEIYSTNGSKNFNDELDNSTFFYRLFVKTGDYTSGTVELTLDYASGSIDGIARITSYTSSTVVDVQVLQDFGETAASLDWNLGAWSGVVGYPSAVNLFDGRLWWAGKDKVWGSVSDAFRSYDDSIEGDSKTVQKTIGFGPSDTANWLFSTTQLIMGLASDEIVIRSSSFGETLTQENANLRSGTNQGSAKVEPHKSDNELYFVQRSKEKLFRLVYALAGESVDAFDLTTLNPGICRAGIRRIAVSRQPETRVFAVLDDGSVRIYLTDPSEDVAGWSRITRDDLIEDVVILPGLQEDRVYFLVNRGGSRYLEKLALEREVIGGPYSKHFDSFVSYTSPGTTITGLSHLEGETVGVWGDGQDQGTATVSSGQITVGSSWTDVVVGLPYTAKYLSTKLNTVTDGVHSVGRDRRVSRIGVVAENFLTAPFKYGDAAGGTTYDMPDIEDGTTYDKTVVLSDYDHYPFEFDGEHHPDSRVYFETTGPVTVMGLVYEVEDDGNSSSEA